MGKVLEEVVGVIALFVILAVVFSFWTQWQAQKAKADAELVKQSGYTNLEVNAGNAILNSIFNR